jgi:hypothetical protein
MKDIEHFVNLKPKVIKGPGRNWFVTDKPKQTNHVIFKSPIWSECIAYAIHLFCARVQGYAIRYVVAKQRGQILKFRGYST